MNEQLAYKTIIIGSLSGVTWWFTGKTALWKPLPSEILGQGSLTKSPAYIKLYQFINQLEMKRRKKKNGISFKRGKKIVRFRKSTGRESFPAFFIEYIVLVYFYLSVGFRESTLTSLCSEQLVFVWTVEMWFRLAAKRSCSSSFFFFFPQRFLCLFFHRFWFSIAVPSPQRCVHPHLVQYLRRGAGRSGEERTQGNYFGTRWSGTKKAAPPLDFFVSCVRAWQLLFSVDS